MALQYKDFYEGQDLHVVRNGEEFRLNDYITAGLVTPTYTIEYPKNTSVSTEGVNIVNNGGIFSITANQYSQDTKITNIRVKITDNTTTILDVTIYIHNSITKAWLSPSPMTIYKDHDGLRLGLFVQFDDGIIANVSWYNGLTWGDISLPSYLSIDSTTGRVTIIEAYPTELPVDYTPTTYRIQCRLPEGLFAVSVFGFINVSLDGGTLEFHKGVYSNLLRKQVIILSDGFTESERGLFKNYAKKALEELESPWNLINNINYWSYFLPSRESGGILEGSYVKLTPCDPMKPENFMMASVEGYVLLVDTIFDTLIKRTSGTLGDYLQEYNSTMKSPEITDFIPWKDLFGNDYLNLELSEIKVKNLQPNASAKLLKVENICDYVGLPGPDDQSKNIFTLKGNWVSFGMENFKVEGDAAVNDGESYLSLFTLEMWKKIFPYTTPSYPDTAFSSSRPEKGLFDLNAIRNYVDSDADTVTMININKFVSTFVYKKNPLGLVFFLPSGVPKLDDNYVPENANNLILLSKIPRYAAMGNNKGVRYGINGTNKFFYNRISIIAADPEMYITVKYANNYPLNSDYIIPVNINFPSSLNTNVKNTIFHEFAHSHFLLDEYTNEAKDLNLESQEEKESYNEYTLESNLQTWDDLKVIRPPLTGKTGLGDNIKWLWPRILKIAFTNNLLQSDGLGNFLVEIKSYYPETIIPYAWFEIGETILLRKQNLFNEYNYFRFKIIDILISSTNVQIFKLLLIGDSNGNTNFNPNDYPEDSIIIFPLWKNSQEYYTLVAPEVVEHINTTGEALFPKDVPNDNGSYKHDKQLPNLPNSIKKDFNVPENIVGLYAGGAMKYDTGLYHPTGFCIMRKTDGGLSNYFCQVCKYILIDAFNPLKHPLLDSRYTDYPVIN